MQNFKDPVKGPLTVCFGNHPDTYFLAYGKTSYSKNVPPALQYLRGPAMGESASFVSIIKSAYISPFPRDSNGAVYAQYVSATGQLRSVATANIEATYPKLHAFILSHAKNDGSATTHAAGTEDEFVDRAMEGEGIVLAFGTLEGQFFARPGLGKDYNNADVGKGHIYENLPGFLQSQMPTARCVFALPEDESASDSVGFYALPVSKGFPYKGTGDVTCHLPRKLRDWVNGEKKGKWGNLRLLRAGLHPNSRGYYVAMHRDGSVSSDIFIGSKPTTSMAARAYLMDLTTELRRDMETCQAALSRMMQQHMQHMQHMQMNAQSAYAAQMQAAQNAAMMNAASAGLRAARMSAAAIQNGQATQASVLGGSTTRTYYRTRWNYGNPGNF